MFRGMRRAKQQLSIEDCKRILREEKRGVLALSGDDGYPYAVPMDFVFDGERIIFHSAPAGHKVDSIRRCDKASFCVIDKGIKPEGEWAYYFNSVIAFGRLKMLEGDEKEKGLRALGTKYFPDAQTVEEDMINNADRCVCFAMTVEHLSGKRVHER